MRILFLSLYPPHPPIDGGRIRTLNILKQTCKQHSVTLVCFEDQAADRPDIEVLEDWCERMVVVPKPAKRIRTLTMKIRDLASPMPSGLVDWRSEEMSRELESIVLEEGFDVAHIDQISLAQYHSALHSLPSALTHHNVEKILLERNLEMGNGTPWTRRLRSRLEKDRWGRFEIEATRRSQAAVTVSEEEAHYFRKAGVETPIFVVPNGVDSTYFKRNGMGVHNKTVVFTGRMDYKPNIDAMNWFVEEILPLIQRSVPEVKLLIVGRDPAPTIQDLGQVDGVHVTGKVDDVRPYYERSSVFITPLRLGGGTRLKILEAMSMEMPVVSTSMGCEGLNILPGIDLLTADTPPDFSDAVLGLLKDQGQTRHLGIHARQTVLQKYEWEEISKVQEDVYRTAIDRHHREQPSNGRSQQA